MEPLERLARVVADQLAPHIITLADFLERFLGQTGTTIAEAGGQPSAAAAPGVGFSVRGLMLPWMFPNESVQATVVGQPQGMSAHTARKVGQ